jgi:hypothetical protein
VNEDQENGVQLRATAAASTTWPPLWLAPTNPVLASLGEHVSVLPTFTATLANLFNS